MNKKGFTLIELLAVILVLGIIALIAIPTVTKVIDQAKKGAFESTVNNVVKAVEEECQKDMLLGNNLAKTYTFENGVASPTINVKGKLPTLGAITVNNKCEIVVNVTDGKNRATKTSTSDELVITESGEKVCQVTTGDGTQIGDEITCGTESFYVYDTTGNNIKMLSKYNLKVGGVYNNSASIYTPYIESEMTYKQDINMRGAILNQTLWYGTTVFSSGEQHGEEYNNYLGSVVENYINRYEEILANIGVTVQDARLITKEELVILGCDEEKYGCSPEHEGTALEWIYSSTYWSASASDADKVWFVDTSGYFHRHSYNYVSHIGVRPVVIISKSEI